MIHTTSKEETARIALENAVRLRKTVEIRRCSYIDGRLDTFMAGTQAELERVAVGQWIGTAFPACNGTAAHIRWAHDERVSP